MSGEVGVVLLLPVALTAVAVLGTAAGLAYGAGKLAGAVGDRLAERQERSWAAADRIGSATAAHDLLRSRIDRERERFGDRITPLAELAGPTSAGADLDRAHVIAAGIEALVAQADQRFRAEVAAARAGRMLADVAEAIANLPRPAPVPGRPASERRGPTTVVGDSLERVLLRMDSGIPGSVAAVLHRRAADALRVDSEATALRLLDDLRYTVDQANSRTRRHAEALRALSSRVAGYTGSAVDDVRARIAAAYDDPEPDLPGLGAEVDAAIEATLAPFARDYMRQALRESLEEIGCTVEEDFDIVLGRDGLAHVQGAGWDDLAVRVRAQDRDNAYYFNLIAPADAAEPDLTDVEHEWCDAVDRLIPALAARGVETEMTHRSEEGDALVQSVDPARFPFERRHRDARRRAHQEPRRRELDR